MFEILNKMFIYLFNNKINIYLFDRIEIFLNRLILNIRNHINSQGKLIYKTNFK